MTGMNRENRMMNWKTDIADDRKDKKDRNESEFPSG